MQPIAYDLCGLKPGDVREITPSDLALMIKAAVKRQERDNHARDIRTARVCAWIVAAMHPGEEVTLAEFMPGYIPKEKKPRGLTPDEIRMKFKAHNLSLGIVD